MNKHRRLIGFVVVVGCWTAGLLAESLVSPTVPLWAAVDAKATAAEEDKPPAGRSLSAQYMNDQNALDEGKALFRGLCSGCHGGAARGGKGPDLTDDRWLHGDGTDEAIASIIERGVPGTTMKKLGESLEKEQIGKIIAYVRSLALSAGNSTWQPYMEGDPVEGEKLYFEPKSNFSCNKCHALDRRGGGIGPSLDRIASRRSAQYIMESIVNPSKDIDPQYEQVLVVTDAGQTFKGLRINESNFNIQIREENGQFHSFNKRDLEELKALDTSMMPNNMSELLTVKQLHDIFAFLMTKE